MEKEATKKQTKPLVLEGKITGIEPFKPGVYLKVKEHPDRGWVQMELSGKSASGEEFDVSAKLSVYEHTVGAAKGGEKVEKQWSVSLEADKDLKWVAWGDGVKFDGSKVVFPDWLNLHGEGTIRGDYVVRVKFKGEIDRNRGEFWLKELFCIYRENNATTRFLGGISTSWLHDAHDDIEAAAKEALAFCAKVEKLANSKESLREMRQLELPPKLE